jgi:hypothetical protein
VLGKLPGSIRHLSQRCRSKRKASAPPRFVEFFPVTPGARKCVIELDGPLGKIRIHWKDVTAAEVADLTRMLSESK